MSHLERRKFDYVIRVAREEIRGFEETENLRRSFHPQTLARRHILFSRHEQRANIGVANIGLIAVSSQTLNSEFSNNRNLKLSK